MPYYSDGEYWSPAEDESNLMFVYRDGRIFRKMISNSEFYEAKAEGYRDSHEAALRVHNIIRSKFNPEKYVQKQTDGRWVEVFPYGKEETA